MLILLRINHGNIGAKKQKTDSQKSSAERSIVKTIVSADCVQTMVLPSGLISHFFYLMRSKSSTTHILFFIVPLDFHRMEWVCAEVRRRRSAIITTTFQIVLILFCNLWRIEKKMRLQQWKSYQRLWFEIILMLFISVCAVTLMFLFGASHSIHA